MAEPPPLPLSLPRLRLAREVPLRPPHERVEYAVVALVGGALVMFISFVVGLELSVLLAYPS